MNILKRIFFLVTIFFCYIIFKELISLYALMSGVHPYVGYAFVLIVSALIIYYILTPVLKIVLLPKCLGPTLHKEDVQKLRDKRIKQFGDNKELRHDLIDENNSEIIYEYYIEQLDKKTSAVKKKYINYVFYATSVSQNGFLDGLAILSSSVNLVKEIFLLYNGRVSSRDLWVIAKKVYYSVAIGGGEGVEIATEEFVTKILSDTSKSIPFVDKILSSLADGYVNALLVNRIAIVTENYCKLLFIESESEIIPKLSSVIISTNKILSHTRKNIQSKMADILKDKSKSFISMAMNPVIYVFEKSGDTLKRGKAGFLEQSEKFFDNIKFWIFK